MPLTLSAPTGSLCCTITGGEHTSWVQRLPGHPVGIAHLRSSSLYTHLRVLDPADPSFPGLITQQPICHHARLKVSQHVGAITRADDQQSIEIKAAAVPVVGFE